MDNKIEFQNNISPNTFDEIFHYNQLDIFKMMYFFIASPFNKGLALWIKFQEINNLLRANNNASYKSEINLDISTTLEKLLPYTNLEQKNKLTEIIKILKEYNQIQEILTLISFMNTKGNNTLDLMNILQSANLGNMNQDIFNNFDLNNINLNNINFSNLDFNNLDFNNLDLNNLDLNNLDLNNLNDIDLFTEILN